MTEEQKKAVKQAQLTFVAALDAGVEEDVLIEMVFEATLARELYIAAENAVVEMFKGGVRWFERMCAEEQAQESNVSVPENTRVQSLL